jgi:hypothetical protein
VLAKKLCRLCEAPADIAKGFQMGARAGIGNSVTGKSFS